MSEVTYTFRVRWADLDPNGHMRHTAYNDYCAQARLMYFEDISMPFDKLIKMGVGPILFREDTRFFKETFLPIFSKPHFLQFFFLKVQPFTFAVVFSIT